MLGASSVAGGCCSELEWDIHFAFAHGLAEDVAEDLVPITRLVRGREVGP